MTHDHSDNPTDDPRNNPRLDALLDEALAPPEPAAALADRIEAATATHLPKAVIAKVGFGYGAALRAAAAVMLVASLSVIIWASGSRNTDGHESDGSLAGQIDLDEQITQLATLDDRAPALIDDQIAQLEMQVNALAAAEPWAEPDALLDEVMLQYELEQWMDDTLFLDDTRFLMEL